MSSLELFQGDKLKALTTATGYLAKSKIVPPSFRGKDADIFSALVLGDSMGLNPMQSLLQIHVINGRPAMSAQLMLAVAKRTYPKMRVKVSGETINKSQYWGECTIQVDDNSAPYTARWDHIKVAQYGLAGKDNYQKQPENMCRWRAVTEALRFCVPDAILGMYSVDEAQDFKEQNFKEEQILEDEANWSKGKTEAELEIGSSEYIFPFRKFANKKINTISVEELTERYDYLETKMGKPKYTYCQKDADEKQAIGIYLEGLE
jgi:hypothetical protein